MEKTTLTVNNGKWRLNAICTERFKMSRLVFHFVLPKDEYRTPLTRLMLAVMLRGSKRYPTVTDINKRLDELYDTTVSLGGGSFGDKSVFTLSCKLINDKFLFDGDDTDVLCGTLDVLSDVLTNPLTDDDGLLLSGFVESEKKIAIDAINSLINDQRAYAAKRCNEIMMKGTPYGISSSGDAKAVAAFTARELTENLDYFRKNARVECYYVGSETPERIAEAIEGRFDCFTASCEDVKYAETPFVSKRCEIQRVSESMDVSQTRICMGYTCGATLCDEDYFAMVVANEIFGGSSVSKLFMNVRERKSLCYYCHSSYKSALGVIRVECGVAPKNCDEAIREIERQLELLSRGEVTESEIQTAKRSLISSFTQIPDSAAAIQAFLLRRSMAGIDQSPKDCIAAIEAVTREQILCAARKIKLDTVFVLEGNEGGEEADYE